MNAVAKASNGTKSLLSYSAQAVRPEWHAYPVSRGGREEAQCRLAAIPRALCPLRPWGEIERRLVNAQQTRAMCHIG
eukprot:1354487-Amphidinium_carterae.2